MFMESVFRQMLDSPLPLWLTIVMLIAAGCWLLPAFGHRVLDFLRDLRDYRAGR